MEVQAPMTIYKAMGALAALCVPLFALGGIFADADGVTGVIGGIGWFGFLACAATLVVLAAIALARNVRRRATA
jgi:hypothetical protein